MGINVEAIEPETIAQTRDANPIIGLALKEDIKGADEEVLNIKPVDMDSYQPEDEKLSEEKLLTDEAREIQKGLEAESKGDVEYTEKKAIPFRVKYAKHLKILLIVLIFLILAALVAGGIYFYLSQTRETALDEEVQDTQEEIQEEKKEDVNATASEEVVLDELIVLIQNGSGETGAATNVVEILQEEGFEKLETANADSYDYITTEVSLKTDVDSYVFEVIERALNSEYQIASKAGSLAVEDDYDVVIIVGEGLK